MKMRGLARLGALASATVLTLGVASAISAASVAPIPINGGNPTCAQFAADFGGGQNWLQVKSDPPGDGDIVVADFGTITVSNFDANVGFDWSSDFGIDAVFVKAGTDKHNLYVYAATEGAAESMGDTGLVAQDGNGNGISHISFCFDKDAPPSEPPSNPPSEPPSEPPSNPPSEPPSNPPSNPPSEAPSGSVATETDTPSGGVEGETDVPEGPATDIGGNNTADPGSSLPLLLIVLGIVGLAAVVLTPARSRRR
jgi:hypothetical protein